MFARCSFASLSAVRCSCSCLQQSPMATTTSKSSSTTPPNTSASRAPPCRSPSTRSLRLRCAVCLASTVLFVNSCVQMLSLHSHHSPLRCCGCCRCACCCAGGEACRRSTTRTPIALNRFSARPLFSHEATNTKLRNARHSARIQHNHSHTTQSTSRRTSA